MVIINMLWEVQHFWLGWFFEEFFTINTRVDIRPLVVTLGLGPKYFVSRVPF